MSVPPPVPPPPGQPHERDVPTPPRGTPRPGAPGHPQPAGRPVAGPPPPAGSPVPGPPPPAGSPVPGPPPPAGVPVPLPPPPGVTASGPGVPGHGAPPPQTPRPTPEEDAPASPGSPPPAGAADQAPVPEGAGQILRDGLDVLRDAGRLLARHWAPLVALAALAVIGRHLVLNLAVLTAPVNNVLGLLVFSLVPLVWLIAVVGMLLVLRRPDRGSTDDDGARRRVRRTTGLVLASLGSVMVPFLLVYEYTGSLSDDRGRYFLTSLQTQMGNAFDENLELDPTFDATADIPDPTSLVVLGTIAAALLVRFVGGRILRSRDPEDDGGGWTWLRLVIGYSEVVWMVLGAVAIVEVTRNAQGWWRERSAAVELAAWWEGVVADLPHLGAFADAAFAVAAAAVGGAIVGVGVPLAWLTIGTIVYGVRAERVVDDPTALARGRLGRLTARVTDRVGAERIRRAWASMLHPESRFGGLTGGLGLVLAAGWLPALLFCAAFLLAQQADYVIWWLAGVALPTAVRTDWIALYPAIAAVAVVVSQVLSIALLASAADALLRRFGARSALRLPERMPSAAPTAAEAPAPHYASTSNAQ
ncbi:hypothetical protein [Beutenbergia cavernae]|uniref:hypothetical protein n=1 Tax=Beutenbergia cavernae TaxID=84757 RepID=UPI00117FFA24|nr:hypothetical protein [Beutenbergia cavernae]